MDTDSGSPFHGGNENNFQSGRWPPHDRPFLDQRLRSYMFQSHFSRRDSFSNDSNSVLYLTIIRREKQKKKD